MCAVPGVLRHPGQPRAAVLALFQGNSSAQQDNTVRIRVKFTPLLGLEYPTALERLMDLVEVVYLRSRPPCTLLHRAVRFGLFCGPHLFQGFSRPQQDDKVRIRVECGCGSHMFFLVEPRGKKAVHIVRMYRIAALVSKRT